MPRNLWYTHLSIAGKLTLFPTLNRILDYLCCTCASRPSLKHMKISAQFRKMRLAPPNVRFVCDSQQTSQCSLVYELRLMKPLPIHMPFESVLRLPFVRNDHGSRNRDGCPYLGGSSNEQSHETPLLTTFADCIESCFFLFVFF